MLLVMQILHKLGKMYYKMNFVRDNYITDFQSFKVCFFFVLVFFLAVQLVVQLREIQMNMRGRLCGHRNGSKNVL